MKEIVQNGSEWISTHQHDECCACSSKKSNPFWGEFQALHFCMAASNRTQHKKRAIRTKRFRIKTIPALHNLLKSLRCKNPRNDFAEPPHFVQRVRKILIDASAYFCRCAVQDAESIVPGCACATLLGTSGERDSNGRHRRSPIQSG
jgi:hypothetical protein